MSANSTISSNLRLVSASVMPRTAALRKMFSRPLSCGWKPAPVAIRPAIRPRVSTSPPSGLMIAVDQLEQRALAGAVEAHEADRLALLDREGDVVEGRERVADAPGGAAPPPSSA